MDKDGARHAAVRLGIKAGIGLKKDQRPGMLTKGVVKDIMIRSPAHPLIDGNA